MHPLRCSQRGTPRATLSPGWRRQQSLLGQRHRARLGVGTPRGFSPHQQQAQLSAVQQEGELPYRVAGEARSPQQRGSWRHARTAAYNSADACQSTGFPESLGRNLWTPTGPNKQTGTKRCGGQLEGLGLPSTCPASLKDVFIGRSWGLSGSLGKHFG